MKAIKTTYRGIEFKSSLEARWARKFDEAGIRWDYEPLKILPKYGPPYTFDFVIYFGERRLFIEVKPNLEAWKPEQKSSMWAAMRDEGLINDKNNAFLLIYSYPGNQFGPVYHCDCHDFFPTADNSKDIILEFAIRINCRFKDNGKLSSLDRIRLQYELTGTNETQSTDNF